MQLLLEDFVGLQALISNNWENRNEDWVKLKSVEGVRWKQDWIHLCTYPGVTQTECRRNQKLGG